MYPVAWTGCDQRRVATQRGSGFTRLVKFKPLASVVVVIAGYLIVWVLAYALTMLLRGDPLSLRECYVYFTLAWTFQAGELPGFIWLLSVVGFLLLFGGALLVKMKSRR